MAFSTGGAAGAIESVTGAAGGTVASGMAFSTGGAGGIALSASGVAAGIASPISAIAGLFSSPGGATLTWPLVPHSDSSTLGSFFSKSAINSEISKAASALTLILLIPFLYKNSAISFLLPA